MGFLRVAGGGDFLGSGKGDVGIVRESCGEVRGVRIE